MDRSGLLDLNEALQHPGTRIIFDIDTPLSQEADIDLTEPVKGTLEAISTGNALIITADLKATAVVECARCAEPVAVPVSFRMEDDFSVEGTPSAYSQQGFAKVVPDEPTPIFSENCLIQDEYIRQGLLLNLPARSLCAACKKAEEQGEEPEFAKQESINPAMAQLQGLLSKEDNS